jgi:hypothetical protein
MGKTKEKIGFSEKADTEFLASQKALHKNGLSIVSKTKQNGSHLVIADEDGNIKKIPAKDL